MNIYIYIYKYEMHTGSNQSAFFKTGNENLLILSLSQRPADPSLEEAGHLCSVQTVLEDHKVFHAAAPGLCKIAAKLHVPDDIKRVRVAHCGGADHLAVNVELRLTVVTHSRKVVPTRSIAQSLFHVALGRAIAGTTAPLLGGGVL